MIVNIAGWVYLIQGALGLWSLTVGPFGWRMSLANLVTLLASALAGLIGFGLLKRDSRARWWALGSSLISWVIGGLIIVVGFFAVLYFSTASSGSGGGSVDLVRALFSGAGFIALIFGALTGGLFIAVTVIMFKLFWYLCSREGCEEFGVEYGSGGTVLASVGAWIAVTLVQGFLVTSGMSSQLEQVASLNSLSERREADLDVQREAARQETREAIEREEERQRAALLEEAQQALAQSQESERLRGNASDENYALAPQYPTYATEAAPEESEAPAPALGRVAEEEEKKPNQILKCRDKAGAVSYTQGYCPPGTTLVDSPQFE